MRGNLLPAEGAGALSWLLEVQGETAVAERVATGEEHHRAVLPARHQLVADGAGMGCDVLIKKSLHLKQRN